MFILSDPRKFLPWHGVVPLIIWTFVELQSSDMPRIFITTLLFTVLLGSLSTAVAQWTWTPIAALPMPMANHTLCGGQVSGEWNVYAFGGITTGLTNADIHRSAFRYDLNTDQWSALPDIPDTLGKIASAASVVGDVAYVIGGYHVLNGAPFEISSNRVHRLDLLSNTWLADGAPVPVPIDDQVQAVWRDSLIYVIAGWSNTTNVPNVQIYDPAFDQWAVGTPVPNNNQYKAFGASGVIIGDTIYYFGGASTASNFPAQDKLRIGHIDPLDPTIITWLPAITGGLGARYRSACIVSGDRPTWVGGSAVSYNFDAVAYNGSGVVQPTTLMQQWNGAAMTSVGNTLPHVMDLRGAGDLGGGTFIIAGGIGMSATVLDSVWLVSFDDVGIDEPVDRSVQAWPNPASDHCTIRLPQVASNGQFTLRDALGRWVKSGPLQGTEFLLDLHDQSPGNYLLEVLLGTSGAPIRLKVMLE